MERMRIPTAARCLLEDVHDIDMEYLEECIADGETREECRAAFERVNTVRRVVWELPPIKWCELKKEVLQNEKDD